MRVECANEERETSVEHSRRSAYPSRETEPGAAKMDCHRAGPRPNPFAAPGPDLRTTEVGSQGGARASGYAGYAEPPFQHGAPRVMRVAGRRRNLPSVRVTVPRRVSSKPEPVPPASIHQPS